MAATRRLFLIDGTALAYRSHFAFAASPRGGLTTSGGRPTGAIYGFTMTLRALLEREHPDLCAVSFDGPRADLERTKVYPEYKSTRAKAPDEMLEQLDDIQRIVEAYGIPIVHSPGHEADDVIGTLAVQGRAAGMQVFIVTGDKDFMQLVDDSVKLWNLRSSTREPEIIGAAEVRVKYGVAPEQMVDLLALMGDSSDNIPGVPRVGPKTASNLLEKFQSLDRTLAHTDEVTPPSIQKALQEHGDLARLSRELVTIRTDVPTDLRATDLRHPEPDVDALRDIFLALEFESLAKDLPRQTTTEIDQDYRVVRDEDTLAALLRELRAAGSFAIATETTSLDPMHARLCGVSVCARTGVAYYVPFNAHPPVVAGGPDALLERLRPLLEEPAIAKTGQNIKLGLHVFENAGIELRGVEFDTMLASYCLSPGVTTHSLDVLALRYFSYKKIPQKELIGSGKKQKTFEDIDVDLVGRYAAEDADLTWRLRERMAPDLERDGLLPVFAAIEMPLVPVLLDMERAGIRIDVAHLERLSKELGRRIRDLEERIFERAGEPFNVNSPAQIGHVLFEQLEVHRVAGMPRPRKTKTGQFKTDAGILEKLAPHHEVPKLILDYRQLSKLAGTYVDSLPTMVNPDTGRIHTTFNQAVAATGRLSSDNPNLQNIPIRTAEGREVRRAFIARDEGWVLLSADYSQIELRILAHMAQDKALTEAFARDEDIHTRTAALVHGMLPGMVTPEMRNQAKVINYGLVYGMGPSRLAAETGMTPVEARKFIEAYFKTFPGVKRYLDATLQEAREQHCVTTLFGRRRPLPDIHSPSHQTRVAAENMAVNTPIQGTAADIIKRAMIVIHAELGRRRLRTKLLLQVHDELVLDVPKDELREVEVLVRDGMAGAAELSVPLSVAIGHGASWLDAH